MNHSLESSFLQYLSSLHAIILFQFSQEQARYSFLKMEVSDGFTTNDFLSHYHKKARESVFDSNKISSGRDQATSAPHICYFFHIFVDRFLLFMELLKHSAYEMEFQWFRAICLRFYFDKLFSCCSSHRGVQAFTKCLARVCNHTYKLPLANISVYL